MSGIRYVLLKESPVEKCSCVVMDSSSGGSRISQKGGVPIPTYYLTKMKKNWTEPGGGGSSLAYVSVSRNFGLGKIKRKHLK